MRLLTRADDLGSFHSANRAILEAYRNGIVRNASVLVVAHCFDEAADMVRDEKDLCLGLHATITAEWDNARWRPALPCDFVPGLVDDQGYLVQRPQTAHEQGADVAEVMAEVTTQLEVARGAGLDIKYLDTHMGFAWIEDVDYALQDLCDMEGLVYANAIDGFERLRLGETEDRVTAVAEAIATREDGGYVLVAHPAYDDPEMREVGYEGLEPGQIARERETERMMFMDERVLRAVEERGVELVKYTDA